MKRFYRYTGLSALILVIACTIGQAQQKLQMKLGYNFSTPLGSSFKSLVNNTSFRGAHGEITYPVNEQLNIGLAVSHNDFYQKYPRQVVVTKNGDISAVISNSVQVTPLLAKVNYAFLKEGILRPYAGLGAGFNFINYNHYLGEFPDSKSSLKPALQADAGLNILLSERKGTGLNIGANFNYLPFKYNEIKNLNNWGIHAGVFFPLR